MALVGRQRRWQVFDSDREGEVFDGCCDEICDGVLKIVRNSQEIVLGANGKGSIVGVAGKVLPSLRYERNVEIHNQIVHRLINSRESSKCRELLRSDRSFILVGVEVDEFEVGCCPRDHEHEDVVVGVDGGCLEVGGGVAAFQEDAGED